MKTIAIIDDDIYIQSMLTILLEKNGYRTVSAYSGTEALLLVEKEMPDLVLLDLMLPGLMGEEVLKRINDIPVIVLSAKNDPKDKVWSLTEGAVDYMTKPFDNGELLARIKLRIKENFGNTPKVNSMGFTLDTVSYEISYGSRPLRLTPIEFTIMKMLILRDGGVITKSSLLECLALENPYCTESSLKQHISNLRRKIEKVSGKDKVESVWGVGFRLV